MKKDIKVLTEREEEVMNFFWERGTLSVRELVALHDEPRPVPLDKIFSVGCNEVWIVTAADSEKVKDFNINSKAGLSYSFYGDSVALRGTVEVITDDETRNQMWQEYFINYFPLGPKDPNYVLVHFIGKEATIWINREFARITI